ncbi:L,D-transpeptidase family protein [Streptacidiphilus carbonis]|uniref:L,D-transpeptidase n=1 Tax=Streptacidiphilus carbonis TaxID=105422 RepID=UPI000AE0A657|nr:Ig-like domain-containing protein [Streptacidiphilus carbonis]
MGQGNRVRRSGLRGAAVGLSAGLLALLTACGGGGSGQAPSADSAPAVSAAVVTLTPGDGAAQVPAQGGVGVAVASGTLTQVRLRDDRGDEVPGAFAAGAASWKPTGKLLPETRYTLDAIAADSHGLQAAKHAVFTTFVPTNTFIGFYSPENGSTVGVGMEVSLRFNRSITDRAAVQRAVTVTASPSVPVAGHWFGDRRLDFRPQNYWRPGTEVVLALNLKGVEGAPGVYGTQSKKVAFTIGRAQISTADTAADTLTVRRGGELLRTLPISAGGPGHASYDGIMVISEMYQVTRMNSQSVGLGSEYDIPAVPHAMRLTDSGTFVHGVYWRPASVFGSQNTSHGCIGLHDVKGGTSDDTPAGWLYDHSMIGDVVQVTGSAGGQVAPDNGMGGWNLSWSQWTAGSAVR